MDAFSVAGLALAAFGAPVQFYSSCVFAFSAFKDVQGIGANVNTLAILVKVQRTRFLVWGQNFDIYKYGSNLEKLSPTVHETLVHILVQIKELLEECTEVGEKYGLKAETIEPLIEQCETKAREEISRQATMVYKVEKSCNAFRKLRWSAYDRAKFETMVTQLTSLVDALYQLCPADQHPGLTRNVQAEVLATTLIDDGRQGVQALEEASQEFQSDMLDGIQTFAKVMTQTQRIESSGLPLYVIKSGQPPAFTASPDILISYNMISIINTQDQVRGRSSAMLSTRAAHGLRQDQVIIEWYTYNEMTLSRVSKIDLQIKIESLVRMLGGHPKGSHFRRLHCIGYFEDPSAARFGIVYRYPDAPTTQSSTTSISLYRMLRQRTPVPALEDRFALATTLAESLFSFLASGWLHKTINSLNILFFCHQNPTTPVASSHSIKEPYLSGFARSRMVNNVALTSMGMAQLPDILYSHPDVMAGERRLAETYHALYDIYSLGTLLLEIGTWTLLERHYVNGTDGPTFRGELVRNLVPQLGPSMGTRYMQLTAKCIEGRFDGLAGFTSRTQPDYNLNLLRSFHWEVVSVLKSLQI